MSNISMFFNVIYKFIVAKYVVEKNIINKVYCWSVKKFCLNKIVPPYSRLSEKSKSVWLKRQLLGGGTNWLQSDSDTLEGERALCCFKPAPLTSQSVGAQRQGCVCLQ